MDTDYTINQPLIGSLQDALNLAFGKKRIQVGQCLKAQSVEEVCALVEAAHRFGAQVHLESCPEDALAIDLSQLSKIRDMDTLSHLVTAESGISIAALESALQKEGLTLGPGHFSNSSQSLGAALGRGEGAFLVVSIGAVLPDGTLFHTPVAPRRATGPNPDALLVGTQMRLAMTVWATLRVRVVVHQLSLLAWRANGEQLLACCRTLLRQGLRPEQVHIRKGAKGLATATWGFAKDMDTSQLTRAMAEIGAESVAADSKAPPKNPPQRLGWSALEPLFKGGGRRGLWVGPMDLHGGWARIPGKRPSADPLLDRVVAFADPHGTFGGRK